jgi:hypothetical protein
MAFWHAHICHIWSLSSPLSWGFLVNGPPLVLSQFCFSPNLNEKEGTLDLILGPTMYFSVGTHHALSLLLFTPLSSQLYYI